MTLTAVVLLLCITAVVSDPELRLDVLGIIRYYGFPVEEHRVTTEDQYVLKVFRIPSSIQNAQVVFLQHGLLCSSTDWILNMRNGSLAFILADAGFDVWLGNSRGNKYSLDHNLYSHYGQKFWDFTWDEMSMLDLPATLNYIKSKTGKPTLGYVGHSQGTMTMFSLLSRKPEWAKSIDIAIALAPVTKVGHVKGVVAYLKNLPQEVYQITFGSRDFLPNTAIYRKISNLACTNPILATICENILFLIAGYDVNQMNNSRIPVYTTHTPAGTSVKNMIHFLQLAKQDKFQLYDYGKRENQRRYNSEKPPQIDLTQIKAPVALFIGEKDELSTPEDVAWLTPQLKKIAFRQSFPTWMHLDFLWAMDAPTLVYKDVIQLLRSYHLQALTVD